MIEEETKEVVSDFWIDQFLVNDLGAFIKIRIDDCYTQDYSERTQIPDKEFQEKYKAAGALEKKRTIKSEKSIIETFTPGATPAGKRSKKKKKSVRIIIHD